MSPEFDTRSGRLRLSADEFDALTRLASPGEGGARDGVADAAHVAALEACGAVTSGTPHTLLTAAVTACATPIATLEVIATGPGGQQVHQAWLSLVSAVLADRGDGTYDLAAVGTDFVPTVVARLTYFGRRDLLSPARIAVGTDLLTALSSAVADERRYAAGAVAALLRGAGPAGSNGPEGWSRMATALETGPWRWWVCDISWPRGDEVAGRRLAVLDAGGLMARADVSDRGSALVPTTATEVWRLLTSILPSEEELLPRA